MNTGEKSESAGYSRPMLSSRPFVTSPHFAYVCLSFSHDHTILDFIHRLSIPSLSLTFTSYTHELPSRCKKELLAVADKNNDGNIPLEGIEMLLKNIGASDRISRNEIETILCEEGQCDNKTIDSSK